MDPLTERLLEIVWHIENDLDVEVVNSAHMAFPTRDEAVEAIRTAFEEAGWTKP